MANLAIKPSDINRFEITEVYAHPDAKADIVLVHGLNGHPQKTWTANNGVFWPTELLPISLKSEDASKNAKVRILVYGYNADVVAFGDKSASSDKLHEHAQSLISSLVLERKSEEAESHPIIWVAHSLGGILVKRALELSNDLQSKSSDDYRQIFISTFAILFLGTPHTGADAAKWGSILQHMVDAMVPKKLIDTESVLVKTLKSNNETLQNINLHFLDIYQSFKICMAHETVKTDMKGTKAFIVDQISASPQLPDVIYFGIEATHSGMCKYESKRAPGYRNVATTIKSWVLESPRVIQLRRENEKKRRKQHRQEQIDELRNADYDNDDTSFGRPVIGSAQLRASGTQTPDLSSSALNSTSIVRSIASIAPEVEPGGDVNEADNEDEQLFIKPPGFRPNSLFVGRQEELSELHKILFDQRRRKNGTSAVVIQSMPGGGKTHLAREYVFQHKDDYPGGIFWLRAKTPPELALGFWEIAKRAALKACVANEDPKIEENDRFIKIVLRWLNRRRDWLMVLDGILFDDHFRKFIPDSVNTSLIFTSTEKSVSRDYHFVNPKLLRLPALSAREAQQLLLLELDKTEPFLKDDLKHSMQLVQAMGFLPVVVHVVAQRLKATDEPLARYAKSYAAGPRLRDLGTFTSVIEQLQRSEAFEALNLMMVICFYSQHIPVELISLGLKNLDVPVRARDRSGRSLNNTFKTLNLFALMERNEHEPPMNASLNSKGSRDLLADHIDVIRLHSVVQDFFVDRHLEMGTFSMWLDRAVDVFCCSFDAANERIFRKTNAGLVEDYRLYEIHGVKLLYHLERHHKEYSKRRRSDLWDVERTRSRLIEHVDLIRMEIQQRTPQSSHVFAGGRSEPYVTSIFDRTSSSSDTGGETPAVEKNMLLWEQEDRRQVDSPIRMQPGEYARQLEEHTAQVFAHKAVPRFEEESGYDSDREGSTAMARQASDRTVKPTSPSSTGDPWVVVGSRRSKYKPEKLLISHRTVRTMESKRYRDHEGAFRTINPIDPRVSAEYAWGYVFNSDPRPSRGRISGRSSAEVALTSITKSSPPPVRGDGMIRDRRKFSQPTSERPSPLPRKPTYSTAIAGPPTKDTVVGYRDLTGAQIGTKSSDGASSCQSPTSAMIALQKFPLDKTPLSPELRLSPTFTPMPPYPNSSTDESELQLLRRQIQENQTLDPFPLKYPRMPGPLPYQDLSPTYNSATSNVTSQTPAPLAYLAHDSSAYPESLPSSFHRPSQPPAVPNLSLSTPDILSGATYYPGRPEYSSFIPGYTSQPMSRGPSDPLSARSQSLAETEPLPPTRSFSPRVPPTSFEVYEHVRALQALQSRSKGFEAARVERVEDWEGRYVSFPFPGPKPRSYLDVLGLRGGREEEVNTEVRKQLERERSRLVNGDKKGKLNPTATAFSPHPSIVPSTSGRPSPSLSKRSPILQNNSPAVSSPLHAGSPWTKEEIQGFPQSYPAKDMRMRTALQPLQNDRWNEGGVDMKREGSSGSGGMRIGDGRVVEFGDLGIRVDVDEKRRQTREGLRESGVGQGASMAKKR